MKHNGFRWPVRIYYEDTDAGGVVYHANYLKFFERARTECLRALGYEQDHLREQENLLFAVKELTIDYIKPARFNDALWVSTEIGETRRASLHFHQTIVTQTGEQTLCLGKFLVVCLDAKKLVPKAIPDSILQRMKHGTC